MVYKTYTDKIILVDDENKALAEVDFPPINDYVVNITHTFVDDSMRGQGVAGKLMDKLVAHLRKKKLKAMPTCTYAVTWFEKHPEAGDVLWSQGISGTEKVAEPKKQSSAAEASGKPEQKLVYKTKVKKVKVKTSGTKLPEKALKTVTQLMQFGSALCMAVILVLFLQTCYARKDALGDIALVLAERNLSLVGFLLFVGGCSVFLLAETLWILSRHRYAQNDRLVSLDTGRGITGFVLVLCAELCAAWLPLSGIAFPERIATAVALSVECVTHFGALGVRLALIGLALSVVRRILGR